MDAAPPTRDSPAPLWDLVEETLEEGEFLWRRWQDALCTHAYGLDGVSFWIEERLLGAIDGLRAAGERALDALLLPALTAEDPCRAALAAHVLAAEGEPRGVDAVVGAFRAADPARLISLERGVELISDPALLTTLDGALPAAGPAQLASGLRMRAFQHRDPGPDIDQALASEDDGVQAAALMALRHRAAFTATAAVERHLDAGDSAVRDAAIETGLVRGMASAWARCREVAASAKADAGRALLLVALLGRQEDRGRVVAAVADAALRGDALFALGFMGTRQAAEVCIEAMAAEVCAPLAADAFAGITGVNLADERLLAASPRVEPEEPIPFEQEDLDASLVPTPADMLPWPDIGKLIRWWNSHRHHFVEGQRYLLGIPADLTVLQRALVEAPMRRRHAVALELAVRTGGRYQVETRALTASQRRQMQAFDRLGGAGIPRSQLQSSFSPA